MMCELCGVEISKKNREDLDPFEQDSKFSKLSQFKCLDCNTEYRATNDSTILRTQLSVMFFILTSIIPIVCSVLLPRTEFYLLGISETKFLIFIAVIIGVIQLITLKNILKFEIVNRKTYQRIDI